MSEPGNANLPTLLPLTVRFRVLGESAEATALLPTATMRLDQLLPLVRQIDDIAVEHAIEDSQKQGRTVSCCRGCSACCQAQPVPVTPAEAYAIWRLVRELPEPRQSAVRQRFADRAERLHAAGLAQGYLERAPGIPADAARNIAEGYIQLGLVCPFLEDDACSIYLERPLVCRQYLVTSPPDLCRDPLHSPVTVVPMPIAAAGAMLDVGSQSLLREQYTLPLVLALEYATRHQAELERTFASQELVSRAMAALFRPNPENA